MSSILFICIGFLLAVLWTDLFFDVQSMSGQSPSEEVLSSIAGYYRRVTYKPYMLFVIMFVMLTILILQIVHKVIPAWVGWLSLLLFLIAAGCAGGFIIPSAIRLGSRVDSLQKQGELARSVFTAHCFCLLLILLLAIVQLCFI